MTAAIDEPTATGDVDDQGAVWIVRARATRALERDPELSPAEFAGIMFRELGLEPDAATDLFDELTGADRDEPTDDQGDAAAIDDRDGPTDDQGNDADPTPAPPTPTPPPAETHAPADAIDDVDAAIALHYDRLEDAGVYANLGTIDGDLAGTDAALSCIGNQDFTGWYKSRPAGGAWDGEGRAYALAKEFDDLRDGLERVLYATINYAPTSWFMEAWDRYQWGDDRREWQSGGAPTPDYGDVFAYAPFADVDLADDVKADRPAGAVPIDTLEDALERYIEAFADLAGDRDHVFALDSVGGAYLFVAPTSTAPIAAEFDRDERAIIFDELTDRLNEWLEDAADEVTAATGLADVFEPDLLNNKNRLYKAPLSVHSSLDGVVTPIDTDAPRYDFTPLEDVGDELIDETRAWVDGFTADHRDAVDAIVSTLWSDYYADAGGGWKDALAAWLEDYQDADKENRRCDRDRPRADDIPDDLETTNDLDVIKAKIEAIDVAALAADLATKTADADTRGSGSGIRFDPPWRQSNSGKSCFADRDKFVDLGEGASGGGALEFVALERGIVNKPGNAPTGNDYWRAVNALREEGYHIPYLEGSDGKHVDVLRLFTEPDTQEDKKRQLARALFADR